MSDNRKLYERLYSVMLKDTTKPENPTEEDRTATVKLCRIIRQFSDLFANDYSFNFYTKFDGIMFMNSKRDYLYNNVISKGDAEVMIDAFKDMIDYYKTH